MGRELDDGVSQKPRAARKANPKVSAPSVDALFLLNTHYVLRWELGCRRLTPGLPYLNAVQEANVRVERNAIARVTREGIETVDGVMHTLDAIVCATGFNTNFSARYDIIGRDQKNLRKLWKQTLPQGYMGLCVSGFPNYFSTNDSAKSYLGH